MPFIDKITYKGDSQAKVIEELKGSTKPIIIYGSGVYAYVLINFLKALDIKISNIAIDKEYIKESSYLDIDVIPFESILSKLDSYNVVLGMANYPVVLDRYENSIANNFIIIDVPDFLNIPKPFMDYQFVYNNQDQFEQAHNLLEDDLSKKTFIASINTKINKDVKYINPIVEQDHLYYSYPYHSLSDHESFLDVGGYNGDSIKEFNSITNGEYNKIISLEPFENTFDELNETIRHLGIEQSCTAVKVGAWNECTQLSFNTTELDIDNKIIEGGTNKIDVDTIDSILIKYDFDITMLKMDINGAEYNALKGASKTIVEQKPKIAVKVHVKENYYKIPILLKSIAPNIKLYLRQRNQMSMMLVLYGVFD